MNILESTFEKHRNLMLSKILNENAPPFNSGGIYFRIMTGNYKNEEVVDKMEKAYPGIKVYRDRSMTANEENGDGVTLLLRNTTAQVNVYKDLLNKKVLKVIEWPRANPKIGGKKRFYRLLKSPNVEGYIPWSDIENTGIGSLDRIEIDVDDDKQGITITIDSNFEAGFGTDASATFDEFLYEKKTVRLVGII